MAKVNADLYEFLKETAYETGMYRKGEEVFTYAHICFHNLEEFVEIIGKYWFEEGGLEVIMFYDTVCIELNDIFKSEDNNILDYKNCFNEEDIESYSHLLIKKE